jgi:preprotein translocase subunit SecG
MKPSKQVLGGMAMMFAASIALPVVAQEKKTEAKKAEEKKVEDKKAEGAKAEPAKAKGEKVAGDIGLLDTEKNYMIVVTKDGKLVTLDFNAKTKATEIVEKKAKMSDVGLGSSANVEYVTKGEKNFLSKMTFVPAKGE